MSSLCGKMEIDIESNTSPHKFHEMLKHRPHHIPGASGDLIQGCELHEGEWGKEGSVVYWNYFHEGKPKVAKEVVEDIDDENNSITYRVIEGDLLEHYKTFKFVIQANPKKEGEGSIVNWTIHYEKLHDEIIDPHTMVEFVHELTKYLDTHLYDE
ncbi:MLP-like protein 31 [Humulus lupulus]|uniref:MLP-like protein 31 n=1 Tax=Humulus lupulus TaxID=3486 RepID=UPI002B4131BF|nr:MLP-like protein 31 [Humulus lupulus]